MHFTRNHCYLSCVLVLTTSLIQNINFPRTRAFHIRTKKKTTYRAICKLHAYATGTGEEGCKLYPAQCAAESITQIEKCTALENRCPSVLPFATDLSPGSVQ